MRAIFHRYAAPQYAAAQPAATAYAAPAYAAAPAQYYQPPPQ